MPTKLPHRSDFPPSLTLTLTPPPPSPSQRPPTNILILLHGLGDTHPPFTSLASALQLAETTILTLQAPNPLPFGLPGFHWGDDMNFDSRTGELDIDAGFTNSARLLVRSVIMDTLVAKCGYTLRDILLFGYGQGGMLSLVAARDLGLLQLSQSQSQPDSGSSSGSSSSPEEGRWLAGVISIGAAYPLSRTSDVVRSSSNTGLGSGRNRTPVLLLSGRDSENVTESAVKRTRDVFEFVEVDRYARRGDTMPQSREEMVFVMRFLSRRLKSYQGVPEGSIEIS